MSVTKRVLGDYNIVNKDEVLGTSSNVTVKTNWMYIDGNLFVGGNATATHRTDSFTTDNTITLNAGETGPGVSPPGTSGVEIDRGTLSNVSIRWNETKSYWELTNNGTEYRQIVTGNATAISNVYADGSPTLSSNLNLFGRTIFDSTVSNVAFDIAPSGTGGSGMYSINNNGTNELILKRMALIYTNLL